MRPFCKVTAIVALVVAGAAHAAPPTVVPSPGYDARLQESRAAAAARAAQHESVPVARHHQRKKPKGN